MTSSQPFHYTGTATLSSATDDLTVHLTDVELREDRSGTLRTWTGTGRVTPGQDINSIFTDIATITLDNGATGKVAVDALTTIADDSTIDLRGAGAPPTAG